MLPSSRLRYTSSSIEALESRIAPAVIVTISTDLKSATWTDVDGDFVTLKASKAIFHANGDQFTFLPQVSGDVGSQLALLDLHALTSASNGVSLTFTAKRDIANHRGDAMVNVGQINAAGLDLGTVIIPGDLGAITAGDGNIATVGISSITTLSGGALGTSTQGAMLNATPTYITWEFTGSIGTVTVKGDFHAALDVQDTNGVVDMNLNIKTGAISIWGDLVGGPASLTGFVDATSGDPIGAGYVFSEGNLGAVLVKGSVLGSDDAFSGEIATYGGTTASVTIGGDLRGGSGLHTGEVSGQTFGKIVIYGEVNGEGEESGQIISYGDMPSVIIGGDLSGGDATNSGYVYAFGKLGNVTIGGSVLGGDTDRDTNGEPFLDSNNDPIISKHTGAIGSGTSIGSVIIRSNLNGGDGVFSGSIFTEPAKRGDDADTGSHGPIKSITVGGTVSGGSGFFVNQTDVRTTYSIYADGQLGAVKLGAVNGNAEFDPVRIVALGKIAPTKAADALAIASVTVARGMTNANILAGYDLEFLPNNPDVQIGPVKVGNNFIASSISAGTNILDHGFGDPNNEVGGMFNDDPAIKSRIASVTIGGYVLGNPNHLTDFITGLVAQDIGAVKIGTTALELTATSATNRDVFVLGASHDFFVREVPWV